MSKIDARATGEVPRHRREVDDPGVRDDQRGRGVAVEQTSERVGDRRQATTPVDQDRDASLGGEREDGLEAGVVGEEPLRTGMQLDPARAEVEAPDRLLEGRLVQIEADERHELVGRGGRVRERPVVRGAERRMPVGLVEAEDVRARDPVRALDGKQLVGVAGHPVDVLAEMDVRVEDGRSRRQLGAREVGVLHQQAVRALDRVHALSLWRRGRAGPRLRRAVVPRAIV